MSTTDYATDIGLPDFETDLRIEDARLVPEGGSKPLKGLYFGFAFVVTAGLALASWYVGVRIVSAEEVVVPAGTSPTSVSAPPVTPATSIAAPAVPAPLISIAEEKPVEFYLQAAGLGPRQDAAFVKSLKARGFHAQAQTPEVGDARIVIGPFSSHAALERAQRKLQGSGVLAVEAVR
jgi:SPOR domain